MASELASLYVSLVPSFKGGTASIQREFSSVPKAAESTGKEAGRRMGGGFSSTMRKAIGPALALLSTGAVVKFAKSSVGAFSELEDSTAAAGVVFGKNMGSIIKQSQGAAKSMGLTQQQVINAANTFGTYGKAAGLSGKDLADFSTEQTALAADMASFKGTSPEQAIEAIGAALRGEMEPIRAYGVLLDDASLRNEALKMGLISTTKDALTPQQKTLAAQALILKQTTDAQGDFARTSTSTANIQKTLSAATSDVSAKFGQVLAPAFTAARTRALGTVEGVSALLDKVIDFQGLLAGNAMTPDLVKALGLDPSTGFGSVVNEGIGGIRAFSAAWKANDGDITSSGFPGWMEGAAFQIRTAVDGIKAAGSDLVGGDFSQVGPLFDSLMAVARPAGPLLMEVGGAVGEMSGEIGELVASALPLLIPLLEGATGVMTFLAENSWALTTAIIAVAGGFIAVKAAQVAGNVAQLLAVPVTLANATANWQLAAAIRAANTSSALQVSASKKTGIAMFGMAATTGTAAVTTGTYAGAATGASIATRALGFAVKALPFVGLAALIAGAVAGLIWFFTETEAGKEVIANVWGFIQTAIGGVVDWFNTTAVPIFQNAMQWIGDKADWLYQNVITPAFSGIQTAIGWVVGAWENALAVAAPVFAGIGTVIGGFWLLARGIFQVIVSIIKNILIPAFVGFWQNTIVPVFAGIGSTLSGWWNTAKAVFGFVVGFIRGTLAAGFTWFRDVIINPVFSFIGGIISRAWTGWKIIFGAISGFLRVTLGPAFTWFRDSIINPVFNFLSSKISGVWNDKVKPVFDVLSTAIKTTLPKAFQAGKDAIGKAWAGLESVAKTPVRFVVETVINKGLIANFNKLADILPGVERLPDVKLPKGFAKGGLAPRGWAMVGEEGPELVNFTNPGRVYTAQETAHALSAQTDFGGNGMLDMMQGTIKYLGNKVFVESGGAPGWQIPAAVEALQGLSGLDIRLGNTGKPRVQTSQANFPAIGYPSNALAMAYGRNNIVYNTAGSGPGYSPVKKRAVSIHEILHTLGFPHTNAASIMQPYLANYMMPTAYDIANMQRIYGPPKSGAKPEDGGGSIFDMVGDWLNIDSLMKGLEGAGIIVDIVKGVGSMLVDGIKDWVGDLVPDLFDNGGWLMPNGGRPQLVQNKTGEPEAIFTKSQLHAMEGSSSQPPVVYVENPWTGEQVRAVVKQVATSTADQRINAASREASTMRRGRA